MLAINTILHPTDFSEQSEFAFQLACALAHDYRARLIVLHVAVQPMIIAGDGIPMLPPDQDMNSLRCELEKIRPDKHDVKIERLIFKGDAATEIIKFGKESNCDIIVLGTHGRSGFTRFLMGSVAEEVIRNSTCPVVTIKAPAVKPVQTEEYMEDESFLVS